ncbi:MAG TPA: SHOCT domain-containing protein [Syntrophales bacterium]|nr:SHOCT domain-containing protein [Syntrophales bacterium]
MKNYLFSTGMVLLLPVRAFADTGERGCWYGWGHMMGSGFGGIVMWILLLIAVVLIVYALMRTLKGGAEETPLDVLKKRYAKGEISKEQFDGMKKDLEE